MTEDKPPGSQLEHWINVGATVIAPTTLLGALLFTSDTSPPARSMRISG
jgi:hypothetical protein